MRLKKLQVSGFKSFVDLTDIRLPSNLVGVVGPNGCGKSNVIDAVRWVMGETSVKLLRGEQMADVIFNGSASRKPVGKASVELVFDNSEGAAKGSYARFAEISVKRTLTRDGFSVYSINNIKTRRKDVLDLFRGTGLGPRSYSIIEQGMVSHVVEARPEDLRLFVEEAAGTSRYKERRRETENRIRHTRENLDRLADIRGELDKQLQRLQRQAIAAQRFKVLREEERQINGQLQLLKLRQLEQQLGDKDRTLAQGENKLQFALAAQREAEAVLEKLRKQHAETQDKNNRIQQQYYEVGADIKQMEQAIEHLIETRKHQAEEIDRLISTQKESKKQLDRDIRQRKQIGTELDAVSASLCQITAENTDATRRLELAETVLHQWTQRMERFNEQARGAAQQCEVEKSRLAQLGQHLQRTVDRRARIEQELTQLDGSFSDVELEKLRRQVAEHDKLCATAENDFRDIEHSILQLRRSLQEKRDVAADMRAQHQEVVSRLNSLQEIQNATIRGGDTAWQRWLEHNGLAVSSKLAVEVRVIDGWERAADRILGDVLGAVCVDQITWEMLENRPDCQFALISGSHVDRDTQDGDGTRLIDKVSAQGVDLSSLMGRVLIAETLQEALQRQPMLTDGECVITREGAMVGANWVSMASDSQLATGVLVREEEISQLSTKRTEMENRQQELDNAIGDLVAERDQREDQYQRQRSSVSKLQSDKTSLYNRLGHEEARHLELAQRVDSLGKELADLNVQAQQDEAQIKHSNLLLRQAMQQSGALQEQRQDMLDKRDRLSEDVLLWKEKVSAITAAQHEQALQNQRLESALESIQESIDRSQRQYDAIRLRLSEIDRTVSQTTDPVEGLRKKLAMLLDRKVQIEKRFSKVRNDISALESKMGEADKMRSDQILEVNKSREVLEQHKMMRQEVAVRRQTQAEVLLDQGYEEAVLVESLPKEAEVDRWEQMLADLQGKINRIGPVNLVAIEEFEEENERKSYLDKQHADLMAALETLESVIRKIDKETRTRFKETFDRLNQGFNEFFPRLFGGGKAELQLTGRGPVDGGDNRDGKTAGKTEQYNPSFVRGVKKP